MLCGKKVPKVIMRFLKVICFYYHKIFLKNLFEIERIINISDYTNHMNADPEIPLPSDNIYSKNESAFQRAFAKPNIKIKKSKPRFENVEPVAVVEDLMDYLQVKEKQKELKKKHVLINKQERARNKEIKEQEQSINKIWQDKKKKLTQEKRNYNTQLKNFESQLKTETDKEKKKIIQQQQEFILEKLEEINQSIMLNDLELLQKKVQIKQEKLSKNK